MVRKNVKKRKKIRKAQDQFTVVLEAIQSDFQIFGEKLDLVEEKLTGKMNGVAAGVARVQNTVDLLVIEIAIIKDEIRDVKRVLDAKADIKRVEELEKRVKRIEAILIKN